MSIEVGPATYLGIEHGDQLPGSQVEVISDCCPDVIEESFPALPRWHSEQCPIRVFAHVVSEKIESFLYVRDDCLLGGKFQPSLLEKLYNEGLDLRLQQFFCPAGNDEVIRIADVVEQGALSPKGTSASKFGILFPPPAVKPIKRHVVKPWRDNTALW